MYYSEAAGLVANKMYSNIKTFSGGIKAWKAAGYAVNQSYPLPAYKIETIDAQTFKKNFYEYCVVDIRIRKHYAMGFYTKHLNDEMVALSSTHRKKYIHKSPLPYLTKLAKKIPYDRKIVVLDYKGKQAPLAARFLRELGHDEVYMLEGGFMSFER